MYDFVLINQLSIFFISLVFMLCQFIVHYIHLFIWSQTTRHCNCGNWWLNFSPLSSIQIIWFSNRFFSLGINDQNTVQSIVMILDTDLLVQYIVTAMELWLMKQSLMSCSCSFCILSFKSLLHSIIIGTKSVQ